MTFLNAKDQEELRQLFLKGLEILNRGQPKPQAPASRSEGIPDGAWKGHPASERQIQILDQYKVNYNREISKGEAALIIEGLFSKRDK